MDEVDSLDLKDLQQDYKNYKEQLEQVEQLIEAEPQNEEHQELKNGLLELLEMYDDLIKKELATEPELPPPTLIEGHLPHSNADGDFYDDEINTSILPQSVTNQIKSARLRAALEGKGPATWAIGAEVDAVYSADGQWYHAVVKDAGHSGGLVVEFVGYGTKEEVALTNIRIRVVVEEKYQPVAAPSLRRFGDGAEVTEVPAWLQITDTDTDKQKEKKRKLIKSYKKKINLQKKQKIQKEQTASWQSFNKKKGKKRKAGFFTGGSKQSIFSVPEGVGGKVGVVGSGKGTTQYNKRSKHEFTLEEGGGGEHVRG